MAIAGIYARPLPTLDRSVQVGIASGKVISVEFPTTSAPDAQSDEQLLERLVAYFEGTEDSFRDVEIGLTVPTDQRAVLETLRQLKYGTTATVAELTRMTPGLDPDAEEAQTAVREALANNPLPVICPGHRIRDGPQTMPAVVTKRVQALEEIA